MNAARPEAEIEYSTTLGGASAPVWARGAAVICVVAGALALLVAAFLPLQRVETIARDPVLVRTVAAGPHNGWALLVLAVVALLFVAVSRSRTAFAGVLVFGLLALGVALLVDRSGLHSSGAVKVHGVLVPGQVRAGVALYLETLGGVLLVVGGAVGLPATAARSRPRNRETTHRQQTRE